MLALLGIARAEEPATEVDPLALASILVRDGAWDRAEAVLADVSPDTPGVDAGRLHLLRGIAALRLGRPGPAAVALEAARAAGQADPAVALMLAEARYSLGDADGTLDALDAAGEAAWERPAGALLRARCHWQQGRRHLAWEALAEGARRFPGEGEIQRQTVLLLVELGLFREAEQAGRQQLARPDATAEEHLALAEALRQGGRPEEAARLLEDARLRFPDDERVPIQLTRAWSDAGRPVAAATVVAAEADARPALSAQAAEVLRRAGRIEAALHANGRVPEGPDKLRQRLGLLLDAGRFEQAAAMEERLERSGLLSDDNLRYALAFAFFRTGRPDRADRQLARIKDATLFEQAAGLRQAMEPCRPAPWRCQ